MSPTDSGRAVCRRVTKLVAESAPPDLGRWDIAWALTAGPADLFMDRLRDWEEEDTEGTREALSLAAGELLVAWVDAAELWAKAGKPQPEEEWVPA